jgi:hypothetical protein
VQLTEGTHRVFLGIFVNLGFFDFGGESTLPPTAWNRAKVRPTRRVSTLHWQRSINDFFESGIGTVLPSVIFLAISLLLYARSLARTRALLETSLVFGITNLAALIGLLLITIPVQVFLMRTPANLTPEEWSYWGDFTREWPLTLIALLWFAGLFAIQPRLAISLAARKASRKEE